MFTESAAVVTVLIFMAMRTSVIPPEHFHETKYRMVMSACAVMRVFQMVEQIVSEVWGVSGNYQKQQRKNRPTALSNSEKCSYLVEHAPESRIGTEDPGCQWEEHG